MYTAGVLVGAPLWGVLADRIGLGRVPIIGLVGYVASLLVMLVPEFETLWGIYALRAATGFFVAAVVPVVSALVAEHTPELQRARRFAWAGRHVAAGISVRSCSQHRRPMGWVVGGNGTISTALTAQAVIRLSAIFGAVMMLGLARTLPERIVAPVAPRRRGHRPRRVSRRSSGSAEQSRSCCRLSSSASCFRANSMSARRRAKWR